MSTLSQLSRRLDKIDSKEQGKSVIIIDGNPDPEQLNRLHAENPGAVVIIDNIPGGYH
jgi:hypothetical protein